MAVDYGSIIQAGQNLVPDVLGQLTKENVLRAQTASLQAEAAVNQQKVTRAQQFQQDIHSFDGSPTSASHLMMKYPEFAEPLKQAYGVQDESKKQADLLTMGEIYSAANGGNWKLAKQLAHTRADAEKAAGHDDPTYDATLNVLDAAADGDQTQQNVVKNMLGMSIAAITGPDKFTETYGALTKDKGYTLGQGETRFGEDNKPVASVAAKPDFLVVPEGGKAIPLNPAASAVGTGGGGPASGGAGASTPAASGGPDEAITHVLSHEGGYLAKDGNGYPTNFGINAKANSDELSKLKIADIATMTKPQAIQIYKDKYWPASGAANLPVNLQAPYFDVYIRSPAMAKQLLAKSGGDPVTFATMAKQTFQQLAQKNPEKYGRFAKAWANRDDDNIAATGGVSSAASPTAGGAPSGTQPGDIPGTVYGNPKPQARTLTADEATARGLSPAKVYEQHPDGTVSAIGDAAPAMAPGDGSLSGPAYIAELAKTNRSLANQVQGVLDTRLAYPPATARSSAAQQLRAAVLQADPSYDEQAYKRRQTTIQQYTPGHAGPGASMLSAATIINHMYDLAQAARNLPDRSTAAQNAVSSWYASQTNQPWLIKYNEGRKFVASELPKFLNGKAPTEGEQHEHYDSYSPSKGKSGIQTALSTDVDYLYGRYQPLIQAYKDDTGKDLNIDNYAPGQATRAKAAALEYYRANGALPTVVTNPSQAAKLPHGSVFVTPDGRVLRRN